MRYGRFPLAKWTNRLVAEAIGSAQFGKECMSEPKQSCDATCLRRRSFVKASAAGVATMLLGDVFPGRVLGQEADAQVNVASYPKTLVGQLSKLKSGDPVFFNYPSDADHTECVLVKLDRKAGGGVGEDQDIVAFNARCTHMGGDMTSGFVKEHSVLGCSEHLSTFDLTRHGMMVAGHGTDRLPQVILEVDGDEIFAIGIVGLIYGYSANPVEAN